MPLAPPAKTVPTEQLAKMVLQVYRVPLAPKVMMAMTVQPVLLEQPEQWALLAPAAPVGAMEPRERRALKGRQGLMVLQVVKELPARQARLVKTVPLLKKSPPPLASPSHKTT